MPPESKPTHQPKIKLTLSTSMVGNNFNYAAGDVVEVGDAETAERLIASGVATEADDEAKVKHRYYSANAPASPAETTAAAAVKTKAGR